MTGPPPTEPVPIPASNGTGTPPSPLPGASTSGDTAPSHTSRNRRRPEQRHVRHAGEAALTPEEVLRLLAPVDVLQERALLELALTTGILREDMVGIPLEGVDFDQGTVRFYESKKRRTRTVPMDARVMVTLRSHVRTLENWRRGSDGFSPHPGGPGGIRVGGTRTTFLGSGSRARVLHLGASTPCVLQLTSLPRRGDGAWNRPLRFWETRSAWRRSSMVS